MLRRIGVGYHGSASGIMCTGLQQYLKALQSYASEVCVPGLDVVSGPLPLDEIFVEPQVHLQTVTIERKGPVSVEAAEAPYGRGRWHPHLGASPEPAGRVLPSRKRVVILGEPGQGKSMLLRQYAVSLAGDVVHGRVPLLAELGRKRGKTEDACEEHRWLHERLPEAVKEALGREGWGRVCAAIVSGDANILLDGLDELEPEAQAQVRELAGVLASRGNQVILSSRPHIYRLGPLGGFEVFELRELKWEQITHLAESLCRALAPQLGGDQQVACQKVLDAAQGPAAELARNPLLLSFLCLTAVRRQASGDVSGFATRPAPLIRDCVEALVEWHRTHRPAHRWPTELDGPAVTRILGSLALETFRSGRGVIPAEALEKLAEPQKKHFVQHLLAARFVERRNGDYTFPLETFREYFAAQAVAASTDPYAVVKRYLHRPAWERVILYAAGSLERTRASRLDLLCPPLSRLLVKTVAPLLRVAASLLGDIRDTAREVASALGREVRGPLERWQAESRQSVEFFLVSILRHCYWYDLRHGYRYERILGRDLRLAARCAGGVVDCPERLVKRLVGSLIRKDPGRWWRVMRALVSALKASSWLEYSLGLLHRGTDAFHDALGEASTCPEVRRYLIKLMQHPDSKVRHPAGLALLRVAASDSSVRKCFEGLNVKEGDLLESMIKTQALEVEGRESERSDYSWIGPAVADALQGSADELGQSLREFLEADPEYWEELHRALQEAASQPAGQQRFLELILYHDNDVRDAAVRALKSVASEADLQKRLLELTRHKDDPVRHAAVRALEPVAAEPTVRERLLELTGDKYALVRRESARALEPVAVEPAVRDRLLELTREEDASVRSAAASALQRVASDPHLPQAFRRALRRAALRLATESSEGWGLLEAVVRDIE
ncbi:MAG: HEAT repeat domain-containing protein [Acidobacteria bacterium]|nr:HEAT repeat domain-containing protein [Acidobacteriota bacterium]